MFNLEHNINNGKSLFGINLNKINASERKNDLLFLLLISLQKVDPKKLEKAEAKLRDKQGKRGKDYVYKTNRYVCIMMPPGFDVRNL